MKHTRKTISLFQHYSTKNHPIWLLQETCFLCYRVLWSPQIRVLVVTTLVTRNCSGKAKLTLRLKNVQQVKNTKTEIINAFPKWFEGGLLTPGKSSMCATLARRTVTPTANLRERGEGGAVHCGALCSVYCFANSTVVISTEYFLTTFNVQYTIWNLCSAIYNMCTVQVHFVIAPLCSRNNQRRLFSSQTSSS